MKTKLESDLIAGIKMYKRFHGKHPKILYLDLNEDDFEMCVGLFEDSADKSVFTFQQVPIEIKLVPQCRWIRWQFV